MNVRPHSNFCADPLLASDSYRGLEGMKRWVGLAVLADNLINIGKALACD